MAYNYSPWLLEVNKEAVEMVIHFAQAGGSTFKDFEIPDNARQFRHKISELLANLARNRPHMAYVRNKVRTWINYTEVGHYRVYVGVPTHKVGGRPPGAIQIAEPVNQTGRIHALGDLAGAKQLAALASNPAITRIIVEVRPADSDFLAALPDWELESQDPFTIRRIANWGDKLR